MFSFTWLHQVQRPLLGSRPSASRRRRIPKPPRARPSVRPHLEALEERLVPSTYDVNPGGSGGALTLQAAISAANATPGTKDTIVLAPGTYNLLSQLEITDPNGLTLEGSTAKASDTVIDASSSTPIGYRAFLIDKGGTNIVFQNLTIQGGTALEDGTGLGKGTTSEGGGILDKGGNVTLSNVVVQNNEAVGGTGLYALGGGVYSTKGSLTINNSVIHNNKAIGGNVSGNAVAGGANGGGIYANNVTITASTLSDNTATSGDSGNGGYSIGAYGGGVSAQNATITASILSGNRATGGISDTNGGGSGTGGGVFAQDVVTITASILSGNTATGGSGSNGGDAAGGGLFAEGGATITASTLSGNTATGGNADSNGAYAGSANGGGYSDEASSKTTIMASTLSGNSATGGNGSNGAYAGSANGGGTYFSFFEDDVDKLTNSTIAENLAIGGAGTPRAGTLIASGGGVYFGNSFQTSTATFTNVTVADNAANTGVGGSGATEGGGIEETPGANSTVTLTNTLVALNKASSGPDVGGAVNSGGHNLIGNADGVTGSGFHATGDQSGSTAHPLNPKLGPLANNGGPTQTIALLAGSPAIGKGDPNAQSVTGPNDQRGPGFARVADGTIDIGAFQFTQPTPPPTPTPPSLFQALISLYIDGVYLEIDTLLHRPSEAVQASIDYYLPYAGPFGSLLEMIGEEAVQQAVQQQPSST